MKALLAALAGLAPSAGFAACAPDHLDIRDGGTSVRFQIEIADTPEERAQGLMFREDLSQFSGMLFVYERPQTVAFWMKNTPLPLDMLFIDESGVVRRIAERTVPFSTDSVPGGDDILLVLEINGGLSEMLGLSAGAEIRHPAVDQATAAWPCAD